MTTGFRMLFKGFSVINIYVRVVTHKSVMTGSVAAKQRQLDLRRKIIECDRK